MRDKIQTKNKLPEIGKLFSSISNKYSFAASASEIVRRYH